MSASVLVPDARLSQRDRLAGLLDKWALGLTPPLHCSGCRDSLADRCEPCADAEADITVITDAIEAVYAAPTEAGALAAYTSCVLGLAGAEGGAR